MFVLNLDKGEHEMQIQISVRHFTLTDSLRDKIHEKLEKLTRYNQMIIRIHVTLEIERQLNKATARLTLPGKDLLAEASTTDMYVTIDDLVKRLVRQIRKYKSMHH